MAAASIGPVAVLMAVFDSIYCKKRLTYGTETERTEFRQDAVAVSC